MSGRFPEDGIDEGAVFSEINIVPLTDIFLVLLIIFMVGASMAVDAASGGAASGGEPTAMTVELPHGAARDLAPGSGDVAVVILADGRVLLGGEELPDDGLLEALEAARERAPSGQTLIVQADEGVHHGRVVQVMERARAAGFTKLAVATRGDD